MKRILLLFLTVMFSVLSRAQTITENEKATILHMWEEEKMARDIYLTLKDKWNHRVFSNISESETYHMSQIKLLIERYKLEDPVTKNNDKRGVFENKAIQKMYNELTAAGSGSLESAFRAGAKVEETDIKDLKEAIAGTANAAIKNTYEYLVHASENHLRAFVRNLSMMNIVYEPVLLNKEEFNKIIGGKRGKMGMGRNN
jgi:hypothetical protein